jgi:hypothetical protein
VYADLKGSMEMDLKVEHGDDNHRDNDNRGDDDDDHVAALVDLLLVCGVVGVV